MTRRFQSTVVFTVVSIALVLVVHSVLMSGTAVADTGEDSKERATEPARPTVVLLVSVTAPGGVAASFGSDGTDEISVRAALAKALGERGFTTVSAAGEKVTRVATGEEASAPILGDASAADLARKVGAGIAVIVGIEGTSDGKIRGTSFTGGIAAGSARLLDVSSSRVIAETTIGGAGWGADVNVAVERAFRDAAKGLAGDFSRKASKAWPADVGSSSGRSQVVIRGARTWGSVSAIIRRLATTKGVTAVHPESVSGDEVRLGLETSLSRSKVIGAIRDTRMVAGSLSVKTADGTVNVSVRGD